MTHRVLTCINSSESVNYLLSARKPPESIAETEAAMLRSIDINSLGDNNVD
jgi:hypothetical protein